MSDSAYGEDYESSSPIGESYESFVRKRALVKYQSQILKPLNFLNSNFLNRYILKYLENPLKFEILNF